MSEFFNKMKKGSVLGFVLCILFGVIICIWPGTVLSLICRVAGGVILAFGIYSLVLCSKKEDTAVQTFQLVAGIVMCVLGVWIDPVFFIVSHLDFSSSPSLINRRTH